MNEQDETFGMSLSGDPLFNKLLAIHPENISMLYSVYINLEETMDKRRTDSRAVAVTKNTSWGTYVLLHSKEVEALGYRVMIVDEKQLGDRFNLDTDVVGLVTRETQV